MRVRGFALALLLKSSACALCGGGYCAPARVQSLRRCCRLPLPRRRLYPLDGRRARACTPFPLVPINGASAGETLPFELLPLPAEVDGGIELVGVLDHPDL